MNFQGLSKVEKHSWYIDTAFHSATKIVNSVRGSIKGNRLIKSKNLELARMKQVKKVLSKHLTTILTSFPSIDQLPEFYYELIRIALEYDLLKKSLGAVKWAIEKIDHFFDVYSGKIKKTKDFKRVNSYRREFYGRLGSILKQIRKQLDYLEHARKTMKAFPSVKSGLFTIAIAGFPNVGKTTLLTKLTGSTAEIANYAFTTKRLNIGYMKVEHEKIQLIDTPGTLNRFDKMNPIEQQAYLAMKLCADLIIFVFDVSFESYGWDVQLELLRNIRKFGKEVIIYTSKTDIVEENDLKLPKGSYSDLNRLKSEMIAKMS